MRHTDVTASGLCVHTGDDGEVSPAFHLGGRYECSTVAGVVAACLAALPGVDGAAVAVMTGPDARQTVHASDGVSAIFALPLGVTSAVLGVLDLYRTHLGGCPLSKWPPPVATPPLRPTRCSIPEPLPPTPG